MAHNSINSEVAAQRMIERGVRPLEPYTSSGDRWKCECLTCGAVVYPRYGTVVTAGKGGCDFCAKEKAAATRNKRIREEDFPKACANAGVTPLSEFKNAFEKIDLQCETCGHEFGRVWSSLRDGKGCPRCSRKRQRENELAKFEPIATGLLLDAQVHPVGPFVGMAKPFPGVCLQCGSEVRPRPAALQSGQGGCFNCGRIRRGSARRLSRRRALEIMASRDIEIHPDEPYPGNSRPWPGKCSKCGLPVASTVGNALQGRGGCRVCHSLDSDSAFDFFGRGILYLIASEKFRAYKLGIAGIETTRLAAHRAAGWDQVLFTYEAKGFEVNYVEQFVLSWLREELGVKEAVSNDVLPEKGGTETWAYGTVPPEVVWEKAIEQFEAQEWPIPLPVQQGTAKEKARRTCTLVVDNEQCLEPYLSNGYCRKHNTAWRKYGDPLSVKRVPFANTHCPVVENGDVCNKPAQRSAMDSNVGMCQTHYYRNFEYGDPTFMKRPTPRQLSGACSIEGCRKEDYSLGFCKTHYHEDRRKKKRAAEGRPEPIKYQNDLCEVEDCGRKRTSMGMCHLHYSRKKRYGSPQLAGRGSRMMEKLGSCRVEDCASPDVQKGLCLKHYSREYKRKRRGAPSLLDG